MLMTEQRYLTAGETASLLRTSPATVYRWVRMGYLPAVKIGHELRIADSHLNEFLENRRTSR